MMSVRVLVLICFFCRFIHTCTQRSALRNLQMMSPPRRCRRCSVISGMNRAIIVRTIRCIMLLKGDEPIPALRSVDIDRWGFRVIFEQVFRAGPS